MSYFVNKTDGTVIVVLDGTKDTTSTSLTLFGRLSQNYGDQTNENFVHLLENFALSTSPANPITGQVWYDTSTNNLKQYTTANTWVAVGSIIQGNVDFGSNLELGPYGFAVKDLNGNVQITNSAYAGNTSFYNYVLGGGSVRTLHLNASTGLVEVNANAVSNFGVTTKIYVDSEIQRATAGSDTNLIANVAIINANLIARVNAENDLRANITAANAQIALKDTISRVNSINSAIYTAFVANLNAVYSNLAGRYNQTIAVEDAMIANVAGANTRINGANAAISSLSARVDAINLNIDNSLTSNLGNKVDSFNGVLTGVPTAPIAAANIATSQIATTAFVMATLGSNTHPKIQDVNLALIANVQAINIELNALRGNNIGSNTEIVSLSGDVTAIATQLSEAATNSRVDAINLATRNAIVSNISIVNGNITAVNSRLNSVNNALTTAFTANLTNKADINSPILTGNPRAPTASAGDNSQTIATTAYVMARSQFWGGSRKFVSTGNPSSSDGSDGDIWFKYIP